MMLLMSPSFLLGTLNEYCRSFLNGYCDFLATGRLSHGLTAAVRSDPCGRVKLCGLFCCKHDALFLFMCSYCKDAFLCANPRCCSCVRAIHPNFTSHAHRPCANFNTRHRCHAHMYCASYLEYCVLSSPRCDLADERRTQRHSFRRSEELNKYCRRGLVWCQAQRCSDKKTFFDHTYLGSASVVESRGRTTSSDLNSVLMRSCGNIVCARRMQTATQPCTGG